MELRDFKIGESFWTQTGEWRCTDIGSRVVVAIKVAPREIVSVETIDGVRRHTIRIDDEPSSLNGPPYEVDEIVFDEYGLEGCFRSQAELIASQEALGR